MRCITRVTCLVAFCFVVFACGGPSRNNGDDDGDALIECRPDGSHRCLGASYQTCTSGLWQTAVDCAAACLDHLGCVQCTPGQTFCKDGNVWSCDDTGNPGSEVSVCTGVNTCIGGSCVDACADAASSKSYIGCEYWAADLDNATELWGVIGESLGQGFDMTANICTMYFQGTVVTTNACIRTQGQNVFSAGLCDPPATMGGPATCPANHNCLSQQACVSDAQRSPFAVVVSNPQAKDATVTITGPGAQTVTRVVPAGAVNAIVPQMNNAIPDQSIDGSVTEKRAYKIVSDLPIVAYQFNPLDNVNVFSNDASLLIPRTAFDADYYVMSWPTLNRRAFLPGKNPYYGYLTVVASADNTQIAVTPKVATTASATNSTIAAGATVNFTLNAHDVLQLQASGTGDLTGTHIVSTNMTPFGVFGGHEATAFGEAAGPTGYPYGPYAADHLEEMMFPSTTWGMNFAIARSKQRTNEPDYIRVLAQKPNTSVTFTPAPFAMAGGNCSALSTGEYCDVKIMADTEITATQPVLVGQFLQSSTWSSRPSGQPNNTYTGTGDPSMAIAVPIEQYRKDYAVLVPAQYTENHISIAAAATGGVTLNGQPVTLMPFGGGATHRVARIPVAAGQHKITCADGCSVLVYGYSDGVSYMFAGGLDLKPIVIL